MANLWFEKIVSDEAFDCQREAVKVNTLFCEEPICYNGKSTTLFQLCEKSFRKLAIHHNMIHLDELLPVDSLLKIKDENSLFEYFEIIESVLYQFEQLSANLCGEWQEKADDIHRLIRTEANHYKRVKKAKNDELLGELFIFENEQETKR